jgi:hypothetical protein
MRHTLVIFGVFKAVANIWASIFSFRIFAYHSPLQYLIVSADDAAYPFAGLCPEGAREEDPNKQRKHGVKLREALNGPDSMYVQYIYIYIYIYIPE